MPLQKDWLFFFFFFFQKKKNLMSSETESIVKYLFWDCYVIFWPSHHQLILNPYKCLKRGWKFSSSSIRTSS